MKKLSASMASSVTPGFWVHRTDGTDTDISYVSAVKGDPKSNAQEFSDACRGAAIFSPPRSVISNLMAIAPAAYRATCRVAFFVFLSLRLACPQGERGSRLSVSGAEPADLQGTLLFRPLNP